MKHLYLFWLSALILLGVAVPASAADTDCIVSWNIPGAIALGSYSAITDELDNASQYAVPASGRPYFYAKEGYAITKVESTGTSTPTINSNNAGQYVNFFNGPTYQGKTVTITVVDLSSVVRDQAISLNIENGAGFISSIKLSPANSAIEYSNGIQTVYFAEGIDTRLKIEPNSNYPIFSVKKDETNIDKSYFSGCYEIDLTAGSTVTVRVFEGDEPVVDKVNVTLDFADDTSRSALQLLFNKTQSATINERETFEVNRNDQLNFSFNTKEYEVSLTQNGTPVNIEVSETQDYSVWTSPALTDNTTFGISATERQYGTTDLTLAITDPDGVILHEGTFDGPVIDLSSFTPVTEGIYSVYTIPVNSKNPKIFIEEKEGWWLQECTCTIDGDIVDTTMISPENGKVYAKLHKINKDKTLTAYFAGDSSKVIFKDAQGNNQSLTAGYTTIEYDPAYNAPFSVQPMISEGEPFSVFLDESARSVDENGVYSGITPAEKSVLHIFAGIATPERHTITVTASDKTSKVVHDKVKTLAEGVTDFTAFAGTEVEVTPRTGCSVSVDGEPVTLSQDGTYAFNVTSDHNIGINYTGTANIPVLNPADGDQVESLGEILISFPEATSAERNAAMADDEIIFCAADFSWSPTPGSVTIAKVEGTVPPQFKITADPAPIAAKNYILDIPAGFFIIDGDLSSAAADATLTLKANVDPSIVAYTPDDQTAIDQYTNPYCTFVFDESATVAINEGFADKITVKVNDDVLTYSSANWSETDGEFTVMTQENMFMVTVAGTKYQGKACTLTVTLAAGALSLSGTPSQDLSHTWEFIKPKEYTYTLIPDNTQTASSLAEFTLAFDNADSAELNEDIVANPGLRENSYEPDAYSQSGTITKVEDADKPTFKITFDPAPAKQGSYIFNIRGGKFLLDGNNWSPEIEKTYMLDTTSGVTEISLGIPKNATIFSIDGRILVRKADKTAVDSLEKGIYIVNGKKILKK